MAGAVVGKKMVPDRSAKNRFTNCSTFVAFKKGIEYVKYKTGLHSPSFSLFELFYLLHLVDTSDDHSDPDVDGLPNDPELVGNLDGQLSCGCQDQSVNAVGVDT